MERDERVCPACDTADVNAARLWLPPLLLTALILIASGQTFSSSNSGAFLAAIVGMLGIDLEPATFASIHFLARKTGHVVAYGLLGALYLRAFRHQLPRRAASIAATLLTVLVVASIDEWRQSTTVARSGTPADVALDVIAAAAITVQKSIWRTKRTLR